MKLNVLSSLQPIGNSESLHKEVCFAEKDLYADLSRCKPITRYCSNKSGKLKCGLCENQPLIIAILGVLLLSLKSSLSIFTGLNLLISINLLII